MKVWQSIMSSRATALCIGMLTFALTLTTPVEASTAVCGGRNLLPALAKEKPALYSRIVEQAARIPNHEAMLWKIERRGAAPSYLLGTMHTSDPRIAKLTEKVEEVLLGSRTVAVEIAVFSRIAFREYMAKNQSRFMYADGSTLATKLTPNELRAASAAVKAAHIPEPVAGRIRPWFAYFLVRKRTCEHERAMKGYSVLDQIIADEARNNRIKVVGLETVAEQLEAFASLSDETQVRFLKSALEARNRANNEDQFETLIHMYLDRRINMMMPMTLELTKASGGTGAAHREFEARIGIKRNYVMRDRALPLIKKGHALIAVGAMHLIGEEGLVALLRKAGYTVTAIE